MKKITILTLVLTMMLGFSANAKKKPAGFAGTITYKVKYEGRELSSDEEAQMPNQQISYFTADKKMDKIITPMGYYKTVMDYTTNKATVIIDMMGQSMYGTFDKDEFKKEGEEDPEITINKLEATKTIAGYKCKKAEIITKKDSKEVKTIIYYTEELKPFHQEEDYKDINGTILETEIEIGEGDDALTMITTATEVKKGKVKPVEFLQPSGATELTKEQLMQMGGIK